MDHRSREQAHLSVPVGVLLIVVTLIGWSSVPLFIKHFSHLIDAWTSNGWRYGFSALVWLPVLVWGWRAKRLPAGLWRAALVPALFNTLGQAAFAWAHYKIEPGLLTFGLRLQIVFIGIGVYLLFPAERGIVRSWQYAVGFVMVLGGGTATVFLGQSPLAGAEAAGVALAVGSGAMFAAYALAVRRYMVGMNSVMAFAAISQYTAAVMVALMLLLGERMGATALALSNEQMALLFASSMIGIALGHVFYYMSIARLGVAVSTGVVQLQPILVSVASYFLFGEVLTAWQWAAGAAAITGALLMLSVQGRMGRGRAARAQTTSTPADEATDRPAETRSERMATASATEKAPVS
ncbi:MAG: DMT family transporter [Phycisphaeraceae bacterium]|nr:DMT family transporter [Phycisphaeraceae bacterium]